MGIILIILMMISTGVDNEINSVAPDRVLDYESNYAGFWNNYNECRTLIRFDVDPSEDPANITLTLYRQLPGWTFSVYEITEWWGSDVTWNTQPDTGDKIAEFTTGVGIRYTVDVPTVNEYGWMIKNDYGETPPCEVWSFESWYPPELKIDDRVNIKPESYGNIKAVFHE